MIDGIKRTGCRIDRDEDSNIAPAEPNPSPQCGSTDRIVLVNASETVNVPAVNGGTRTGFSLLNGATEHNKSWFIWLLLVPVLLLAWTQLHWVTALGPGVHEDSYRYMETAWAFLHGYGFLSDDKPMTHFGPAYPVVLAAAYLVDGNLVHAARWLHIWLYSINIVLIGVASYVISERSVLALVVAPLAVMLSGELLVVYSTAATESPFIAFALATFVLLSMHIKAPRWSLLVSAAVCLGVAMALRYVGVTLLPTAVACLWLMDRRPPAHRLRECFFLSVVSSLPLAAWIVRNLIVAGMPTDRPLAFHPVGLDHLKVLVSNLCSFYLPIDVSPWLKLAVLISIAAVVSVQVYRQQSGIAAKTLQSLIVVFCAIYVSFLFVSMSFFDAFTEFEYRILAPVGVFSIVLTISVCLKIATTADQTWVRWLSGAFVLSVLVANAPEQWRVVTDLHRNGYYYSARQWRESETLAFVRSIPQSVTVYSNDPWAIGYLVGRRARMIPRKISPMALTPAQDFAQSIRAMCDDVAGNGAIVAFLKQNTWYLPTAEELQTACGFAVTRRLADGLVFASK